MISEKNQEDQKIVKTSSDFPKITKENKGIQKIQKRNHSAQNSEEEEEEKSNKKKRNQSKNDILDSQQEILYKKIKIGICAMEKKSKSKPMLAILSYLKSDYFEIIIFEEDTILNKDIKRWPKVDCLISWYSDGFPLKKAQDYVKLVNPFQINDLKKQELLWDRTKVYEKLKQKNIRQPNHYYIKRNNENIIENYYKIEQQETENRSLKKQMEQELLNNKLSQKSSEFSVNTNFSRQNSEINSSSKKDNNFMYTNIELKNLENLTDIIVNNEIDKDQANYSDQNTDLHEFKQKKDQQDKQYLKKQKIRSRSLDVINSIYQETQEEDFLVQEFEDFIMVGHKKLKKPFVEKPFDAENHNIYIYYANADGGGCKKLFRKINDQSSAYDKNINTIRKEGNYIYEEFLPTDDYAHAESRKAPTLDGRVKRTSNGKEFRYPVQLTFDEKCIAKNIVKIFGQSICGFDLLRSNGKSYVIDVNGWSFVKGNDKYNQDCAVILKNMILKHFNVQHEKNQISRYNMVDQSMKGLKPNQYRPNKNENHNKEELRAIVAIFRHGDRTPKQKMKVKVSHDLFIKFFMERCDDMNKSYKKEIKIKNPKYMQQFLEYSEQVYKEIVNQKHKKREKKSSLSIESTKLLMGAEPDKIRETQDDFKQNINEEKLKKDQDLSTDQKIEQLVTVLKMHGSFEGFNRKIQIKPIEFEEQSLKKNINNLEGKVSSNQSTSSSNKPTKLLIVLKWGGELTHAGEKQTEDYGKLFRQQQYQGYEEERLLRLHNSYKHDLKTFTSDEGRCQKTAGHFIQGLLDTKGDVTSTISSLLTRNETAQRLLDYNNEGELEKEAKEQLSVLMNSHMNLQTSFRQMCGQNIVLSDHIVKIMNEIGSPLEKLNKQYDLVKDFEQKLYLKSESQKKSYYINYTDYQQNEQIHCQGESISLIFKRWRKLKVDYKLGENNFNISKIPDIYDNIKYDIIHNRTLIDEIFPKAQQLYQISELLASFVVPCEFGLTDDKKYKMAQEVVGPLCEKIKNDLTWWKDKKFQEDFYKYEKTHQQEDLETSWRHIRTRLYFTNASHLYSMFNVLYLGLEQFQLITKEKQALLDNIKSLQYLSHIVFRLYEDLSKDIQDETRFRLELSLSQGMAINNQSDIMQNHEVKVKELIPINIALGINELEQFFNSLRFTKIEQEKSPKNIQDKLSIKKKVKSNISDQKPQDN